MDAFLVAIGVFMGIFLSWLFTHGYTRDDTDPSKGTRSGLAVYTDHKTGIQYVSASPMGGLTVRLTRDGKPMTVNTKESA